MPFKLITLQPYTLKTIHLQNIVNVVISTQPDGMARSHQRSSNELCSCLVSSYLKYTSLVHVDLGDSKLLTIVEVQQEE